MAGIMLDTRSFALHVGVRTFEAAAWLRSRGAQTADTKLLFNTSKEEYEARAHIVEAAYIYKGCAIALSDELEAGMNVVLPMAANDLLTINGVDASFVAVAKKRRRQYLGAQHGRAERAGHSGAAGRRRPSDDGGCSAPELHTAGCGAPHP